jgi:ubiquinone/menaquinone biosynthesis C-methylase UbiE
METKMSSISVESYDLPERVRTYDVDMEIMHPLRWKMIEISLEILPFPKSQPLQALDLGVGTGVFSKKFLEKYKNARVVAIDGAASMMELAKSRLGELAKSVEWVVSDFQTMPATLTKPDTYDVVISSYALHHLDAQKKLAVIKSAVQATKSDGWFLNADVVVAGTPEVEQRIQEIRVEAVTNRAWGQDKRFCNTTATRHFLDDLEATEQDQPQTLEEDMKILRESGIDAEVFWKEYREVVIGGPKKKNRDD